MKIVIKEKLKEFKLLMNMVKKIGTETNLLFTETELTIVVSDATNAAAKLIIKKEFFDSYEIEGEKEEFGVFVKDIVAPLKFATTELTIEHSNDRIVLSNGKDKFKNPILTEINCLSRLPDLSFDFTTTVTTTELATALTKLATTGHDEIKFYVEDGKLKMKSIMGIKEVEVELRECGTYAGKSYMCARYIAHMADSSNTELKIHMKEENPMMFEYDNNGAKLMYMIAPRVGDY